MQDISSSTDNKSTVFSSTGTRAKILANVFLREMSAWFEPPPKVSVSSESIMTTSLPSLMETHSRIAVRKRVDFLESIVSRQMRTQNANLKFVRSAADRVPFELVTSTKKSVFKVLQAWMISLVSCWR